MDPTTDADEVHVDEEEEPPEIIDLDYVDEELFASLDEWHVQMLRAYALFWEEHDCVASMRKANARCAKMRSHNSKHIAPSVIQQDEHGLVVVRGSDSTKSGRVVHRPRIMDAYEM